jgi:hypothetical protein
MTQEAKIPANHVVGVITGEAAVDDAKKALNRAGFAEVQVIDKVAATGEGTNPISAFIEKLAGHLSDQVAYIDQYKEEAEAGGTVLAVKVDSSEAAQQAEELLQTRGAVNIRHFGRFAVSDMSPETNPSAPSDIRP